MNKPNQRRHQIGRWIYVKKKKKKSASEVILACEEGKSYRGAPCCRGGSGRGVCQDINEPLLFVK